MAGIFTVPAKVVGGLFNLVALVMWILYVVGYAQQQTDIFTQISVYDTLDTAKSVRVDGAEVNATGAEEVAKEYARSIYAHISTAPDSHDAAFYGFAICGVVATLLGAVTILLPFFTSFIGSLFITVAGVALVFAGAVINPTGVALSKCSDLVVDVVQSGNITVPTTQDDAVRELVSQETINALSEVTACVDGIDTNLILMFVGALIWSIFTVAVMCLVHWATSITGLD